MQVRATDARAEFASAHNVAAKHAVVAPFRCNAPHSPKRLAIGGL